MDDDTVRWRYGATKQRKRRAEGFDGCRKRRNNERGNRRRVYLHFEKSTEGKGGEDGCEDICVLDCVALFSTSVLFQRRPAC